MKYGPKVRVSDVATHERSQARLLDEAEYELWSVPSFQEQTPERVFGLDIQSGKFLLEPGDVLLGKINPRINRVWVVTAATEPVIQVGSTEWIVLRPRHDTLDSHYLGYCLQSSKFREMFIASVTGATGSHSRGNPEIALSYRIPLPPLDEQKRIVAKLDQIRREVGRLSDNVAEQMETVKSLRGAALADRLQGENVLQGNVAAGWPVAVLTDHVEVQPPNGKVKRSDFLARGTYPVVSQEVGSINGWWDGPAEVTPVDRPVVLFGDHTRILKYIDHDFVVGADGVKILRPRSSLDPRFLFHLLTANPPRHLGYARHFRLLKELKFRLPPLEEQQSIAAELDGLGVQFDEIESKLAEQETLLSSFQSAALPTVLAGGP